MILNRLTVQGFKNLRDLTIKFDGSTLGLFVAPNGSGKSNLFEAIVEAFQALHLRRDLPFGIDLEYEIRGDQVQIFGGGPSPLRFAVNKKPVKPREFYGRGKSKFLPTRVFVYYSGYQRRLARHFWTHRARFRREYLQTERTPHLPDLFLAQPTHATVALLALLAGPQDERDRRPLEMVGIDSLDSVLFVLQRPSPRRIRGGVGPYWGLKGQVRDLLSDLIDTGLSHFPHTTAIRTTADRIRARELYYIYLDSQEAVEEVLKRYSSRGRSGRDLFRDLEVLRELGAIHDVRVRVRMQHSGATVGSRELSEGEVQLLTVLGLLKYTQEHESLFLLDEPDTHLNPQWAQRLISLLVDESDPGPRSQVLIASHDPLVVGQAAREQIKLMSREQESGFVQVSAPRSSTQGMSAGHLLRSDIFGLRTALSLQTQHDLERKRELVARRAEGPLSAEEAAQLTQLNERLRWMPFGFHEGDPLFQLFEQAAVAEGLAGPGAALEVNSESLEWARRLLHDLQGGSEA